MNDGNGIWLLGDRGMLGRQIAAELQKNSLAFSASDREVDIGDLALAGSFLPRQKNLLDHQLRRLYGRGPGRSRKRGGIPRQRPAARKTWPGWRPGWAPGWSISRPITSLTAAPRRPYRESDPPRPLSQYGAEQMAGGKTADGQLAVRFHFSHQLALRRCSGTISSTPC